MEPIKVKKLRDGAHLPTYGTEEAAGADLYACVEEAVTIAPGQTAFIPTGIALEVPKGCAGLIYARSGMACKRGLAPANKVGVVDSDYRGEIKVCLRNLSREEFVLNTGERVAQLCIVPVELCGFEEVSELPETERGDGGFGSTGMK